MREIFLFAWMNNEPVRSMYRYYLSISINSDFFPNTCAKEYFKAIKTTIKWIEQQVSTG